METNTNVILMGPIGVGKGTVGRIVAERTGKVFIDLDEHRDRIYADTDYSDQKAEGRYVLQGIHGWYRYQKPYELYSVKKILAETQDSVIAFGGGQSVYEDEERKRVFLQAMAPVAHSFLLLPYQDFDSSMALLSQRIEKDEMILNRLFIGSDSSLAAAKHVMYVGEKTPDEIADDIMGKMIGNGE